MDFDCIIYTDGGGTSSAIGGKACAVITKNGKTPIEIIYREYEKKLSCNEAEYSAVLLALEEAKCHSKIKIFSDSMLVVNQLDPIKPWKINFEHLQLLNDFVKDVIINHELEVIFEYVPRDNNLAGLYIEGKLPITNDMLIH